MEENYLPLGWRFRGPALQPSLLSW